MHEFVTTFQEFLTSHGIPDWLVVFIISVCPVLECRLGMFTAISLLQMNIFKGFIISFLGNILPIPFILLLINKIFEWLKKVPGINKPIYWLEKKTLKKREKITLTWKVLLLRLTNTAFGDCSFLLPFRCREQVLGPVRSLLHSSISTEKRASA